MTNTIGPKDDGLLTVILIVGLIVFALALGAGCASVDTPKAGVRVETPEKANEVDLAIAVYAEELETRGIMERFDVVALVFSGGMILHEHPEPYVCGKEATGCYLGQREIHIFRRPGASIYETQFLHEVTHMILGRAKLAFPGDDPRDPDHENAKWWKAVDTVNLRGLAQTYGGAQ